MIRLATVIPALNQVELLQATTLQLLSTAGVKEPTELVVLDNGSQPRIRACDLTPEVRIARLESNVGVYGGLQAAFDLTDAEIVAVFHSDFVIWESEWCHRLVSCLEHNPRVGMVGLVGGTGIGSNGGRCGTVSNFMGATLSHRGGKLWTGSTAERHGRRLRGVVNGAVVDGCAMIIRRSAWEEIGFRPRFPPHHFYDRLVSTQLLEKNWQIAIMGLECDHFSGQTANREPEYAETAKRWLLAEGYSVEQPAETVVKVSRPNWSSEAALVAHNFDQIIYILAERAWLDEYRDQKGLVPISARDVEIALRVACNSRRTPPSP